MQAVKKPLALALLCSVVLLSSAILVSYTYVVDLGSGNQGFASTSSLEAKCT
jgi:uncharacterized protein (UPF0333 family)